MKIRIKGNSIRYRLTRPEVALFAETGYLEEATWFADNSLVYALEKGTEPLLCAGFSDNKITMRVPEALAKEWAATEKVGFDQRMQLANGGELYLLVEKDFKCLDETVEDQSDNYDNPNV